MEELSLDLIYAISFYKKRSYKKRPTCSTLINFLSFAQLSLIREKMSALTLSLPFSKTECAPDHHYFIKSALFFQSFVFFKSPLISWVLFEFKFVIWGTKLLFKKKVIYCAVILFMSFWAAYDKTKVIKGPRMSWFQFSFCLAIA